MDKIVVTPEDVTDKLSDVYSFWGSNRTPSETMCLRGAPLKIPLDEVVVDFCGEFNIEVRHKSGVFYVHVTSDKFSYFDEELVYAQNKGDVWKEKGDAKEALEKVFPNTNLYSLIKRTHDLDTTWAHELFAMYLLVMRYMEIGRFETVEARRHTKTAEVKNKPVNFNKVYMTPIVKKKYLGEVSQGGHHASPQCEFSVRGHWRHYKKSGKTIWVAQHRKGIGKGKRKRVYKL